ncbi:MAG TPA: hypothetical protein VKO87_09895 [Gemmatimonadaceae bacterium]|nr:hypothetical protein [Gemmatimonadaceae bacterium]
MIVDNPGIVRWGSGPIAFELESRDREVIESANRVFGNWRPDVGAKVHRRWHAERRAGAFVVTPRRCTGDGEEPAPIRHADHAVTIVEYAAIAEIVESSNGILCFHAALLSKNDKSIAIVGPSGAGKSTLATGLWQHGWRFHCDDLTMIAEGRALAAPRRVALRAGCREHVGGELWSRVPQTPGYYKTDEGCLFQPMQLDGTEPSRTKLSAVFFLKRLGSTVNAPPRHLPSAHAAVALLPYTNVVRNLAFLEALAPVASLMSTVAAWDLPQRPLPEMIDTVERLTRGN